MNAPLTPPQPGQRDLREVPSCIAKRETDAEYAWSSKRRLLITKGKDIVSLSADDLRALFLFVEANQIEVQL